VVYDGADRLHLFELGFAIGHDCFDDRFSARRWSRRRLGFSRSGDEYLGDLVMG
jgi:hypothetical protein